ncbi:hypothetical protein J1605_016659 [Eschrichtius robustus]|uniref:Uncharacterized protein n=1 Tax=Eschrichtius robustus TaxID=9764 RepID=A0AB34I7H1_ESCRO|nr:hypothetical protein J1605_016659 [Eschrichtius robustus]
MEYAFGVNTIQLQVPFHGVRTWKASWNDSLDIIVVCAENLLGTEPCADAEELGQKELALQKVTTCTPRFPVADRLSTSRPSERCGRTETPHLQGRYLSFNAHGQTRRTPPAIPDPTQARDPGGPCHSGPSPPASVLCETPHSEAILVSGVFCSADAAATSPVLPAGSPGAVVLPDWTSWCSDVPSGYSVSHPTGK